MTTVAPLTPAERAGCWADMIGAVLGTATAAALFITDPRRWLTYTPSGMTISDSQYYTVMGGAAAAFVASTILARVHPIARAGIVAWWTMFAWLLAIKFIGMILGIGA